MYAPGKLRTFRLVRRHNDLHPSAHTPAIVRRYVAGRHLPKLELVLEYRRQALRLPDQIVRIVRGSGRRLFELRHGRSAGQLNRRVLHADHIFRAASVRPEVGVADALNVEHVLRFGKVIVDALIGQDCVRSERDAAVLVDRHAVMEPMHVGTRLRHNDALQLHAGHQLRVHGTRDGLDLRRN